MDWLKTRIHDSLNSIFAIGPELPPCVELLAPDVYITLDTHTACLLAHLDETRDLGPADIASTDEADTVTLQQESETPVDTQVKSTTQLPMDPSLAAGDVLVVFTSSDSFAAVDEYPKLKLTVLSSSKTRFPALRMKDLCRLVVGIAEWQKGRPRGKVVLCGSGGYSKALFLYLALEIWKDPGSMAIGKLIESVESRQPESRKGMSFVHVPSHPRPVITGAILFASQARVLQSWKRSLSILQSCPQRSIRICQLRSVAFTVEGTSVPADIGDEHPTLELWTDDQHVYSTRSIITQSNIGPDVVLNNLNTPSNIVRRNENSVEWEVEVRSADSPRIHSDCMVRILGNGWMLRIQLHTTMFMTATPAKDNATQEDAVIQLPITNEQLDGFDLVKDAWEATISAKLQISMESRQTPSEELDLLATSMTRIPPPKT